MWRNRNRRWFNLVLDVENDKKGNTTDLYIYLYKYLYLLLLFYLPKKDKITTKEQFLSSPLSPISTHANVIDGKSVFYRDWFLKGITEIRHLMENSDKFLSPSSFESRYVLQLRPLNFFGIIAAARCLRRQNTGSPSSIYCSFVSKFLPSAKPSKLIYNKLVLSKREQPLRSQGEWCREICPEPEEDHEINWKSVYLLAFECTNVRSLDFLISNFCLVACQQTTFCIM